MAALQKKHPHTVPPHFPTAWLLVITLSPCCQFCLTGNGHKKPKAIVARLSGGGSKAAGHWPKAGQLHLRLSSKRAARKVKLDHRNPNWPKWSQIPEASWFSATFVAKNKGEQLKSKAYEFLDLLKISAGKVSNHKCRSGTKCWKTAPTEAIIALECARPIKHGFILGILIKAYTYILIYDILIYAHDHKCMYTYIHLQSTKAFLPNSSPSGHTTMLDFRRTEITERRLISLLAEAKGVEVAQRSHGTKLCRRVKAGPAFGLASHAAATRRHGRQGGGGCGSIAKGAKALGWVCGSTSQMGHTIAAYRSRYTWHEGLCDHITTWTQIAMKMGGERKHGVWSHQSWWMTWMEFTTIFC